MRIPKKKKLSRVEKHALRMQRVTANLRGSGVYVFKNRSGANLNLPKPSMDGKTWVAPDGTWKGDSYFMFMVHETRDALLVETLTPSGPAEAIPPPPSQPQQENQTMEQKLILDQPDKVTTEGTVEQVITPKVVPGKPLNEANPAPRNVSSQNTLLNDDASEGIDIILG